MFQWFINLFRAKKEESPVAENRERQDSTAQSIVSTSFVIEVDSREYLFEGFHWRPDRMMWKGMEVRLYPNCLCITPYHLYDLHEIDSMTAHVEYYWNPFLMEKTSLESTPILVQAFAHILCFRNKGFRIRIVSGRILVYVPQNNVMDWNKGLERIFQVVSFWNELSKTEKYRQDISMTEGLTVRPHHEFATQDQQLNHIQGWLLSCFDGSSNDWCTAWWDKEGFHCTPKPYIESVYEPQKTAYYGALLWDWACMQNSKSQKEFRSLE